MAGRGAGFSSKVLIRTAGLAQAGGGAVQCVEGVVLIDASLALEPVSFGTSTLGVALGGVILLKGADNVYAGGATTLTGERHRTQFSQGVAWLTGSESLGEVADLLTDLATVGGAPSAGTKTTSKVLVFAAADGSVILGRVSAKATDRMELPIGELLLAAMGTRSGDSANDWISIHLCFECRVLVVSVLPDTDELELVLEAELHEVSGEPVAALASFIKAQLVYLWKSHNSQGFFDTCLFGFGHAHPTAGIVAEGSGLKVFVCDYGRTQPDQQPPAEPLV